MTPPHPRERLQRGEVHVWWTRLEAVSRPCLHAYWELLRPDERLHRARFRFEKDRDLFTAARVLLRTTLSRYAAAEPGSWRFVAGAYGKPRLDAAFASDLRFNVSHTRGLVACAVARELEVGIDVEDLERRQEEMPIARHTFAPSEVEVLERADPARRRETFFSFWTLKEAYVKARGAGLTIPLREFAFTLDPLAVELPASWGEDPRRWQFARWSPTPRHVMALAFYRPAASAATVREREIVPVVE